MRVPIIDRLLYIHSCKGMLVRIAIRHMKTYPEFLLNRMVDVLSTTSLITAPNEK